jgi:hypothetical protein
MQALPRMDRAVLAAMPDAGAGATLRRSRRGGQPTRAQLQQDVRERLFGRQDTGCDGHQPMRTRPRAPTAPATVR